MENIVHTVWFSICLSFLKLSNSDGDIGGTCTIETNGAPGVCRLLSNCPVAIEALQTKGTYPQSCGGFEGAIPIICCVVGDPPSVITIKTTAQTTERTTVRTVRTTQKVTTKPTTRTTPSTRAPVPQRVGDLSRIKCKEYSKYSIESELPTILIPGAQTVVNQDCAIVPIELIVGGTDTKPKEFPHMALIGFDDENGEKTWQCGGSLISELFVLTAGHCLSDKQFGEAKYVRLGELVLKTDLDDAMPQDFDIAERIKHPDYALPSQYNDIALMKLNRPADLNSYVRPACLDTSETISAQLAVASGWGKIGYTDAVSASMRKVTLEFFTHDECYKSYKSGIGFRLENGIMEKTQVCAGSHDEKKDACQGDSGGPLQILNQVEDCMYTIVGVTSFGKACGIAYIPGVYTRVSRYIEWIEQTVW